MATNTTNTYNRPWSLIDDEELRLLRELEGTVRAMFPDGVPRINVEKLPRSFDLLERLDRLPSRR